LEALEFPNLKWLLGFLACLFESFFTTRGTIGTALGLWVTKQIIDKHSGISNFPPCPLAISPIAPDALGSNPSSVVFPSLGTESPLPVQKSGSRKPGWRPVGRVH
jgi:hypothetical protein